MLIMFEAEAFNRKGVLALVKHLDSKNIDVKAAGMDPTFTNMAFVVIDGVEPDLKLAEEVQRYIWEMNDGLCCEYYSITADQLEEMM